MRKQNGKKQAANNRAQETDFHTNKPIQEIQKYQID
jgi:hypothetical protein